MCPRLKHLSPNCLIMMPKDKQATSVQSFAEMQYLGMDRGGTTVVGQKNDDCVAPGNADLLTNELNASHLMEVL